MYNLHVFLALCVFQGLCPHTTHATSMPSCPTTGKDFKCSLTSLLNWQHNHQSPSAIAREIYASAEQPTFWLNNMFARLLYQEVKMTVRCAQLSIPEEFECHQRIFKCQLYVTITFERCASGMQSAHKENAWCICGCGVHVE